MGKQKQRGGVFSFFITRAQGSGGGGGGRRFSFFLTLSPDSYCVIIYNCEDYMYNYIYLFYCNFVMLKVLLALSELGIHSF